MNTLLFRAVIAFLALPGIVAFIVPLWIATSGTSGPALNPVCLPVLVVGISLLLWCVRDFYVAGRGTLAPWSPPKHLVIVGLYRFSRNPMYIAVILILSGWAIGFSSSGLALYAVAVVILFHLRVIFHEEPWLEREFGEGWVRYRADVPRWIGRRSQRMRTSA
jgi:protein-S-isoprenylcysteine O-methyltransferase Ste14